MLVRLVVFAASSAFCGVATSALVLLSQKGESEGRGV